MPADDSVASVECRCCGGTSLETILDLGRTPLADRLLREEQLAEPEPSYPLVVAFCGDCGLVQLRHSVPPTTLFCDDYPYFSSFSDHLLQHSREHALELIEARGLGSNHRVVEVASNDGYLLKNFAERGIPVLGIDPAEGPAAAAEEVGVPTLCTFFEQALAEQLVGEGRRADVLLANNVLAHVPDLRGFVSGVATLLHDEGIAEFEFPYLRDLIEHCEFDTIYHEHLCYFSATALARLFGDAGLCFQRVRRLPIHGGSLRVTVGRQTESDGSVEQLLAEERELGMDRREYFERFAERVAHVQSRLRALLTERRAAGRRIAAYGAAAKGATLLNSSGIEREVLDFVVDRNEHKVGRFMPGIRLPIRAVSALLEEQPDDVLLLAWNFQQEIVQQQREYLQRGGTFLLPVPEPRVLPRD